MIFKTDKISAATIKKIVSLISVVLVFSLLAGCSNKGPEVGKWHSEIGLNELNLSDDDKMILSLVAGNTAYEMNVEFFDDNTFTYSLNMDKFREEIQKSVSTIAGFFLSFNLDVFIDRIVAMAMDSMGLTERTNTGTYTVDENGIITAVGDNDTQFFKYSSGTIHQLNENGEVILTFEKAE